MYFSVVTFTTLGYGDILPISPLGKIMVIAEVSIGYIMLGLLVAIFSQRMIVVSILANDFCAEGDSAQNHLPTNCHFCAKPLAPSRCSGVPFRTCSRPLLPEEGRAVQGESPVFRDAPEPQRGAELGRCLPLHALLTAVCFVWETHSL